MRMSPARPARTGLYLCLVWVVMLMPALSSAVDTERQSNQERIALDISLSGLYNIEFSQSYATQFYSCLCSDASSECEIMYEIHPSKLYHFQVKRITVKDGESEGSVFICEKPTFYHENNIVCSRQKMENSKCGPSSFINCNLAHLQFPENGCDRKCVSVGFLWNNIHLAQTDIPEGQCDVTEPAPSTSRITSEATTTGLATTALSNTSASASSLSTRSSVLREDMVDSHSENDEPTSKAVTLGIGIGGALVLALIATVALAVLCRRRRAKSRHSYESVQPYASGADSVDAKTDEAERGAPAAAIVSHTAHADGDRRMYTTYMAAGNVYCSIGDEGISSAVAEKGSSNSTRHFSSKTIVDQPRPVANGATQKASIRNTRQQLSKAITVTENGEDGSAGVNVYARLDNGRKEETEELTRRSILETYNTGNEWDDDFVTTETTEPPELPEEGTPLSMAEPFCEDSENAYETIDSLDIRGAASETEESRGGADHLSDDRPETASQEVHFTDTPSAEYFVLEDVANID